MSVSLTPDETHALLQQVPRAYHTQINDALLTALGETLSRWTGDNAVLLDLEGHGRELFSDDVDVSRTVGWFTAIFPVVLEIPTAPPGDRLKSVKEQLRAIPNRGVGYGLLKYLNRDCDVTRQIGSLSQPQLSFNYLGQFRQVLPRTSMFRLASEAPGPTHDRLGVRRYLLDVRAGIYEDSLKVDWVYSTNVHRGQTIHELAESFTTNLRNLIRHCSLQGIGGHTPSDFPHARLDQRELEQVLEGVDDVEDMYALAPLQTGMLFHALSSRDAAAYCMQVTCTIIGALDLAAFERAWQRVVDRHPVLRTMLLPEHGIGGLQLVRREATLKISFQDLGNLTTTQQLEELEAFREEDRTRPFDLRNPPQCRLALFRTDDERHECVWTFHHVVLDGWSAHLVLKDAFAYYGAFRLGQEMHLAAVPPYVGYISWLQQRDLSAAEDFWRVALQGFVAPSSPARQIPAIAGATAPAASSGNLYHEHRTALSAAETAALQSFARQHRLTVNTVVQGAWALVLNQFERSDDVVFGATVTGRPPEFAGVESMVGAFINTLPVRVRISSTEPLRSWLAALQNQQTERQKYEYTPLARIQDWAGLPGGAALFDSILVFENFPADFSLNERHDGLQILNVRSVINEDYPLIVVVEPASELAIRLKYDRSRFDGVSTGGMLRGMAEVLRSATALADSPLGQLEAALGRFLAQEQVRSQLERKEVNRRKLQKGRGQALRLSIDRGDERDQES